MLTIYEPTGVYKDALFKGYFLGSVSLLTSGSGSYAPPTGCRMIVLYCIGKGGASSSVTGNAGQLSTAAGAGGGALSIRAVANLLSGGYTYTIDGTSTRILDSAGNTVCLANAGANSSGTGSGTTQVFIVGGAGGSVGTGVGDMLFGGNAGDWCLRVSGSVGKGGNGGKGPFGGASLGNVAQGAGVTGAKYGGGGSGGLSVNGGGAAAGGAAGPGAIIVWEYY